MLGLGRFCGDCWWYISRTNHLPQKWQWYSWLTPSKTRVCEFSARSSTVPTKPTNSLCYLVSMAHWLEIHTWIWGEIGPTWRHVVGLSWVGSACRHAWPAPLFRHCCHQWHRSAMPASDRALCSVGSCTSLTQSLTAVCLSVCLTSDDCLMVDCHCWTIDCLTLQIMLTFLLSKLQVCKFQMLFIISW